MFGTLVCAAFVACSDETDEATNPSSAGTGGASTGGAAASGGTMAAGGMGATGGSSSSSTGGTSTMAAFQSDWSSAVGSDDNAKSDGGMWTEVVNYSGSEWGSVVSATGLEFPPALSNVLRVGYGVGTNGGGVSVSQGTGTGWIAPAVGETLFMRTYMRNAVRDSVGTLSAGSHHPLQGWSEANGNVPAGNCSGEWNTKYSANSDGTFNMVMFFANPANVNGPTGHTFNLASSLNKNQTYLFEFGLTRTAANTYTVAVRIDGADRTNEYSNSDSGTPLAGTELTIWDPCLETLFIGNNTPIGGWANSADPTQDFFYWGGVAVDVRGSASAWIGPY